MTVAVILLAAAVAAVYLLYPLFRPGARRLVVLVALLLAAQGNAAAAEDPPSIGLLLIAVDVQRDHLRVSEAMRVANDGPLRAIDLTFTLPAGAVYVTEHRGLRVQAFEPGRFRARLTIPRGISEIAYSYALPSGSTQILARTFPLRVQRLEMVIRGRGVRLTASRGGAMAPLDIGGEHLPRWEVLGLRAGDPVMFSLRGLPVSRRWLPPVAAAAFAVVLAGGLAAAMMVRTPL
jgi:hypothetical protein